MRRILFRALTLDEGKPVYGLPSYKNEQLYIGNIPCNEDSLSEYTGVKDSKGQEIFENDKVFINIRNDKENTHFRTRMTVVYKNSAFRLQGGTSYYDNKVLSDVLTNSGDEQFSLTLSL